MTPGNRSRLIIAGTFLVAFLLVTIPGPQWAEQFRPDWVSLVLIYWCLATPHRVGIGSGWVAGLLLDVLYGSVLGAQALAKTLLAFIVLRIHLRVRIFPMWQQAGVVWLLLMVNQLVVVWIKGAVGDAPIEFSFWTSTVIGAAIWPWVFVLLRDLRRRKHVQ